MILMIMNKRTLLIIMRKIIIISVIICKYGNLMKVDNNYYNCDQDDNDYNDYNKQGTNYN